MGRITEGHQGFRAASDMPERRTPFPRAALGVLPLQAGEEGRGERGGEHPRGDCSGDLHSLAVLVHLVRHGEVDNPDDLVYAGPLAGFGLSTRGFAEAAAAGDYLAGRPVAAIVASPLHRARQTAAAIAASTGVAVETDERLTEWGLTERWAGLRWRSIPDHHPGELEAYLADPTDLPFSPESLAAVARRVAAAVHDHRARHESGDVVLVSHQDPIQAARLELTGRPLSDLHHVKPGHASVTTLATGNPWAEVSYWEPGRTELPA